MNIKKLEIYFQQLYNEYVNELWIPCGTEIFLKMISQMLKGFKTINEQIEILKGRGLVFDD